MSSNRAYPGQTPFVPGAAPPQMPGFAGRALQTDLPARLQAQSNPVGVSGGFLAGGSAGLQEALAAYASKDPAAIENLQRRFRSGSQLPMPRTGGAPVSAQAMPSYGYGNLNEYIMAMQQPTMLQPRPDLSNRAYK